jgi:aryl-alcohol dehydrogenase (NADP+)
MFGATEFDPTKERDGPGIAEQVEGMAALVKAGKIRYWGLSNETAWGVCAFRRIAKELGVPGPVALQNSYSLVSRGIDNDLAEVLFREGMSLLAYSPLAGGLLSGKYGDGAQPSGARYTQFETVGARYRKPIVREATAAYVALARQRGLVPAHLALAFVRSRWYLGAAIIAATTLAQLEENIAATAVDLDAATLADIAALTARYPNPAA